MAGIEKKSYPSKTSNLSEADGVKDIDGKQPTNDLEVSRPKFVLEWRNVNFVAQG